MRACLCGGSCCTHQNSHSSRTTNHLHLPHAQDYDGYADRVKDYLRGCLVCDSLAEVVTLWKLLKAMADEGLIEVVQIKNRYRDGSTSSGYADMNINISYEGHVCEVQVGTEASYSRYGPPIAPPSTTLRLLCNTLGAHYLHHPLP